MRPNGFLCSVVAAFSIFMLSGCLSVGSSPSPRFYMLSSITKDQVTEKFDITPGLIVAVGPVNIPGYQDRPQIVTRDKNGMLKFAQFDRWGENLDFALAHQFTDNLTLMLPDASFQIFPCNFAIPLDYQVIIDIIQLDSELDKNMLLVAQWSIIHAKSREMLLTKRSQFIQPINPHDYHGLIQALNVSCAALSSEIAGNLAKLANQAKTKEGIK
ncbi:MAG: PqiC family protein [Candidatus Omnitrophota bacterium]